MDNNTLVKSAIFGTGGLLVGGLYSFLGYVQQSSSPDESPRLSIEYNFLQRDEPILQLFESIEEDVLKLDHVAFVRTVMYVDELIKIRYNVIPQSSKDRVDALVAFGCAKKAIQRFITRGEEILSPRQLIYLQRKSQKLISYMETHLQVIIMITRD
jgi:hypothetical protein